MMSSLFVFRVKPVQSLFNGVVKMSANMSDAGEIQNGGSHRSQCLIQPSDQDQCDQNSRFKNSKSNFGQSLSILDELIELGNNEDFAPFTRLSRLVSTLRYLIAV